MWPYGLRLQVQYSQLSYVRVCCGGAKNVYACTFMTDYLMEGPSAPSIRLFRGCWDGEGKEKG